MFYLHRQQIWANAYLLRYAERETVRRLIEELSSRPLLLHKRNSLLNTRGLQPHV